MEESYNVIKYQLAYATKSGARCRIAKCTLPIMAKGEFRIGTTSSVRSWFHVDCFFKRMTEDKAKSIKSGFIGRENIKEEDLKRIDELSQSFLDVFNKKRKVQEDQNMEDGRWPKRQKQDYLDTIEPSVALWHDNLVEIFSYFNSSSIPIFRALSLVNKQFNHVARSLMYKYGIQMDNRSFWSMDDNITKFVQNFKTLKIFRALRRPRFSDPPLSSENYNIYLNQLTKLPNLASLALETYDSRSDKIEVVTRLSQLTEISLTFIDHDEECLEKLTALKSLQSLEIQLDILPPKRQLTSLQSFAAQIKHLKLKNDYLNLSVFTNLESLDLPLREKEIVPGLKEWLEGMPKLTSLTTRTFAGDMSKLTALKRLSLISVSKEERNIAITIFPPKMEYFSCISELIQCEFPPSMKSIYVGRIETELLAPAIEPNKKELLSMATAIGKTRCPATMYYMDLSMTEIKPFTAAATNPNLTIIMQHDDYSERGLQQFIKFSAGPLPARLFITFLGWKRAARKKKFGKVLEELAQSIHAFAEYHDDGKIFRPYIFDHFAV